MRTTRSNCKGGPVEQHQSHLTRTEIEKLTGSVTWGELPVQSVTPYDIIKYVSIGMCVAHFPESTYGSFDFQLHVLRRATPQDQLLLTARPRRRHYGRSPVHHTPEWIVLTTALSAALLTRSQTPKVPQT